ncbi:DUF2939 domain-containing protein [Novosphingobium huizhouense]|uniref:DUF2939 domain-containing protein n=1 Tax=Novosphingobium huizhouense TaxID=2866625 RepID=UPI001CD87E5C|nr:DUF2939 domain-containing protein [Novosphingobium huizhouense]
MKKWIFGGITAAALFFTGWYTLSPGMAMASLRDAVKEGDKQELQERVDFPKIRDSLKSQFKAKLAGELADQNKGEANGFAAFGAMLAMSMVDGLIDGIVTPDGIKTLIEKGRLKEDSGGAQQTGKEVDWKIEHQGIERFRAVPSGADHPPVLVFQRDGLSWRLVDIEAPAEQPPTK